LNDRLLRQIDLGIKGVFGARAGGIHAQDCDPRVNGIGNFVHFVHAPPEPQGENRLFLVPESEPILGVLFFFATQILIRIDKLICFGFLRSTDHQDTCLVYPTSLQGRKGKYLFSVSGRPDLSALAFRRAMIERRQCDAVLTLKAPTPNDGNGRVARVGLPTGIGE
jgi:hypothetical protein